MAGMEAIGESISAITEEYVMDMDTEVMAMKVADGKAVHSGIILL
jgi:hypothetical protein